MPIALAKTRRDQPRAIIAKFQYRPDIRRIMVRRKDLKDDVFTTANLIREDREKKAEYQEQMKAACNEGKSRSSTEACCTLMGILLPRALYISAKSSNIFC